MEWVERNLWAVIGFLVTCAGWFISLGRILHRVSALENENGRLITDMKEVRRQCSGVSCAEQRHKCDDRFATKADMTETRAATSAEIGEVKDLIAAMDDRREAARSAMQTRWDEISRFMGEMRARLDMERKR